MGLDDGPTVVKRITAHKAENTTEILLEWKINQPSIQLIMWTYLSNLPTNQRS